jgi:hypothetical protein
MNLAMQIQAWGCGITSWEQCPNSSTPSVANLDIDWVVVYTQS